MVIVVLEGITKRFGDVVAASDVNLEIDDGEFFTLLGPSGCGKTTTMRIIAGLEYPDEGKVSFDGKDITHLPPYKRNTGMVFQNYALWPHMKVSENVAYGLNVRKVPKREVKEKVGEALELVKLGGLEDRFPSQLSGGQQQRVALARVLVINPQVLLLDEPLSNLDAKLRVEMREEIKELQKNLDITTIYVTHDQEEAMAVSDRMAIQDEGVIRQVGSPTEIYNMPQDLFIATFIGRGTILEGIAQTLDDNTQVKVEDLTFYGAECTNEIKNGEKVACVMRPENFTLTEPNEPSNVMEGVIEWVAFIGPFKEVKLNVRGRRMLVDIPPDVETTIGGKLKVYIPYRNTIILSLDEAK